MNRRQLICSFAAAAIVAVPSDLIMRSPILRRRKSGVDYAKVDETPNWERQRVIDIDTGRELEYDVFEVDCVDGWALCRRRGVVERGPLREKVLVRGRFRLELIPGTIE